MAFICYHRSGGKKPSQHSHAKKLYLTYKATEIYSIDLNILFHLALV